MWHYNRDVDQTYVWHTSQAAWANISGMGWRRIKDGAADGVTNLFSLLNAAKANGRKVHIYVDSNDRINGAYLI